MIHLVSGLILPLWTTLPFHTVRVYRLQTDDGTRLIGRVVDQQWLDRFTQTPADTPNIHHAWPRLLAGDITRHLADNIALRRVKIMSEHRVELTGHTAAMIPRLKTTGVFTELINWKLRLFVPVSDASPAVIDQIAVLHPVLRATTTPR